MDRLAEQETTTKIGDRKETAVKRRNPPGEDVTAAAGPERLTMRCSLQKSKAKGRVDKVRRTLKERTPNTNKIVG